MLTKLDEAKLGELAMITEKAVFASPSIEHLTRYINFNISKSTEGRIVEWCKEAEHLCLTLKLKLLFARSVIIPLDINYQQKSEIFDHINKLFCSTQKFFGADALEAFIDLVKSSVKKTK